MSLRLDQVLMWLAAAILLSAALAFSASAQDVDSLRTEAVRARGFARAEVTQGSKVLDMIDRGAPVDSIRMEAVDNELARLDSQYVEVFGEVNSLCIDFEGFMHFAAEDDSTYFARQEAIEGLELNVEMLCDAIKGEEDE